MRKMEVFSAREEQILQLLLAGFPTKKIARDLDITVATVKAALRQILRTVNAQSETPRIDRCPTARHPLDRMTRCARDHRKGTGP